MLIYNIPCLYRKGRRRNQQKKNPRHLPYPEGHPNRSGECRRCETQTTPQTCTSKKERATIRVWRWWWWWSRPSRSGPQATQDVFQQSKELREIVNKLQTSPAQQTLRDQNMAVKQKEQLNLTICQYQEVNSVELWESLWVTKANK
jgi:hypothetical protein